MPRKRKSRSKKEKPKPEVKVEEESKLPHSVYSEDGFFKELEMEQVARFMKSDERIIAVAYQIPALNMTSENMINTYKSRMRDALTKVANNRRLMIDSDKFQYKALVFGDQAILKAFFKMSDVRGGQGFRPSENFKPEQGKEGLFVEDKKR